MPEPSPHCLQTDRPASGVAGSAWVARVLGHFVLVLFTVFAFCAGSAAFAAPAPWYYWRSAVDGTRVCAQTSPGHGWERDSPAYDGPGCNARRKVLIIPML